MINGTTPRADMHGILSRRVVIAGAILIFPFFFLGGPAYQSARSIQELWNLGHVLFFTIFAILVYCHLLPDHVSAFAGVCLTLISVIVLGLGIEVVQLSLGNRSVGWDDFFRDLAGAGIVFFWKAGSSGNNPIPRMASRMTACIIAAICLYPLSYALVDEHRARQEFPLLSGFERRLELGRWKDAERLRQVDHPARTGKYSAEIRLTTNKYSGVSLFYFPEDWRGNKDLAFSVFNPGSPVNLHFRVHDRFHTGENQMYQDRFNGMRVLVGGWNDIVIPMDAIRDAPAGRKMDLAHIRGFGLFVMEQAENRLLYLDDVRLLK